jgi:hypothetical protein
VKLTTQSTQDEETDNTEYTRRRTTKQKHNAICVRYHYTLDYWS